jgi:hypothetical protein
MIFLEVFNPGTAILFYALALIYYRKNNVPFSKSFFPFITSMYSPAKMREELKPEGLWLILFGYISFIIWMIRS